MSWPRVLTFTLAIGAVLTPLSGYFGVLLYPEAWGILLLNLFLVLVSLIEGSNKAYVAAAKISAPLLFPAWLGVRLAWPTSLIALPCLALVLRHRPALLYVASPLAGALAAFVTFHYWPHTGDASFDVFISNRHKDIRFDWALRWCSIRKSYV